MYSVIHKHMQTRPCEDCVWSPLQPAPGIPPGCHPAALANDLPAPVTPRAHPQAPALLPTLPASGGPTGGGSIFIVICINV